MRAPPLGLWYWRWNFAFLAFFNFFAPTATAPPYIFFMRSFEHTSLAGAPAQYLEKAFE